MKFYHVILAAGLVTGGYFIRKGLVENDAFSLLENKESPVADPKDDSNYAPVKKVSPTTLHQ